MQEITTSAVKRKVKTKPKNYDTNSTSCGFHCQLHFPVTPVQCLIDSI